MSRPTFFVEVCLVAAALLAACGDATPPAADAGDGGTNGDGGDGARGTPTPPAPAALPILTPCPDGWREVASDDGYLTCEPFDERRGECGADEAHFPGTASCERLGPACPDGDGFPADLPSDRPALFVRAGADGGGAGDGTRSAPFGTIAEATAVAAAGDVIALAEGEYVEEVALPAGVALIGACVAGTTVRAEGARLDRGVINPTGADVEVRNLTIGASPRPGLWAVGDGVAVRASDLAVTGATLVGISIEQGADFDGARLRVRDIQNPAAFPIGRALNVETGATATVRYLDARGSKEFGVMVLDRGELILEDALVAETRTVAPEINGGPGVGVFRGGMLTAARVALEDNQQLGVAVFGDGSTASFTDTVIRRVMPWGPEGLGRLIDVEDGGAVRCVRCLLEEGREVGVAVEDASAELEDTVLRRMLLDADGRLGRGATVQQAGAELSLLRVAVYDTQEIALAAGEGRLRGADLTVRRVAASPLGFGRALSVQSGATVTLARAAFSDLFEEAVIAGVGTSLDFTDLDIREVESTPAGYIGRGLVLQQGAVATAERLRIANVREVAISLDLGCRATLRDVLVSGVRPQACADRFCAAFPGGHGLGVYAGAELVVERFTVEDVALCGVHIAEGSTLALDDGTIRRAAIGACVQSDAQDVGAISRTVDYVDNGSNLEATELPVPEPVGIGD